MSKVSGFPSPPASLWLKEAKTQQEPIGLMAKSYFMLVTHVQKEKKKRTQTHSHPFVSHNRLIELIGRREPGARGRREGGREGWWRVEEVRRKKRLSL